MLVDRGIAPGSDRRARRDPAFRRGLAFVSAWGYPTDCAPDGCGFEGIEIAFFADPVNSATSRTGSRRRRPRTILRMCLVPPESLARCWFWSILSLPSKGGAKVEYDLEGLIAGDVEVCAFRPGILAFLPFDSRGLIPYRQRENCWPPPQRLLYLPPLCGPGARVEGRLPLANPSPVWKVPPPLDTQTPFSGVGRELWLWHRNGTAPRQCHDAERLRSRWKQMKRRIPAGASQNMGDRWSPANARVWR